jgi:uncharacterized protein YjbI with pentapeptide repeats
MLKRPTEAFKLELANYIKNQLDISDLIAGYDIKGLNLSNSIIRTIQRAHENLTNINWSRCIIGYEGANNFLTGCNISDGNFKYCRIIGMLSLKRVIAHRTNFADAYMPDIEYQHADLTDSTFCNVVVPMGSLKGHGAIIPMSQIEKWGINLK